MMRSFFSLSLVLLLLTGCEAFLTQRPAVLPVTADLEAVHDTYRREFAHLVISRAPAPETSVASELRANTRDAAAVPPPFAETLQGIREFRTRYARAEPLPEKALAHLTVLEGMIYLQSNQFGSAFAISDEVQRAGAALAPGDDRAVRDQLFALAYPHLVEAWREIDRELSGQSEGVDRAKIAGSVGALEDLLARDSVRATTDPYVDEGAIYLATTTTIFFTWLHELHGRDCKLQRPACDDDVRHALESNDYYRRACALMGPFLSASERAAATLGARDSTEVRGRLAYLRWYAWLKSQDACEAASG